MWIDHTNGLATPVGSGLGDDFVLRGNGGTIDDGVFYFLSGSKNFEVGLWTVDLDSGVATFVGLTGVTDSGIGLTVGPNGELLGVVNDKLYEIDRDTGGATLIGYIEVPLVSSLEFVDEIAIRCPSGKRSDGTDWKNHGDYVSCVALAASDFVDEGLINKKEMGGIVSEAARSNVGKKKK